jgi:long-chain acyl-CoA synthetase
MAYMPPAWSRPEHLQLRQWLACGYVVNCPESAGTVMIDLKEIGPTYYFAPPRIFEGLLTSVMIRMEDAGAIKRRMFQAAWTWRAASGRPCGTASRSAAWTA